MKPVIAFAMLKSIELMATELIVLSRVALMALKPMRRTLKDFLSVLSCS
jgi:fumarate hydratase class II